MTNLDDIREVWGRRIYADLARGFQGGTLAESCQEVNAPVPPTSPPTEQGWDEGWDELDRYRE